jgi:hypothetical protein
MRVGDIAAADLDADLADDIRASREYNASEQCLEAIKNRVRRGTGLDFPNKGSQRILFG